MSLKVLLVLVAMALVMAPASPAAGAMAPGGCPAGYVAFDRQTGDGGPPRYRQGETVAASGVITNTDAGVTEVTLRWGTADGPELGRAAVDASGAWQGISFQIPQDVANGDQSVFYVARDRAGQMLPGLPYPFTITVGEPVAPTARDAAPAAKSSGGTRPPATKAARPERSGATAAAPSATKKSVRAAAPASSKPARSAPEPVVTSKARTQIPATSRPTQPARKRSPEARAKRDASLPSRTGRAADKPDSGSGLTDITRSTQPGVPLPSRPAVPAVGPADRDGSNVRDAAPVVAAIGLLLLVGAGAYGAGMLAGRRRPDGGDPAGAVLETPEPPCPIDSELHAMLAERERAGDAVQTERRDAAPLS